MANASIYAAFERMWQHVVAALSGKASLTSVNTYNGEQKFQNSQYCPEVQDNASGVGTAYKASRGAVNQEIVGQIIMPYTACSDSYGCDNAVNTIKFQKITGTSDGIPSLSTVATLTDSYLNVPSLRVNDSATLPNSISGNAATSTRPTGFTSQQSTWGWGTTTSENGYTQLTDWQYNGGEICFSEKDNQVFCQLNGYFYQREGGSRCLDTSDIGSTVPPAYTYSTTDLTAGISALETGKLYIVYE